MSFIKIPNLPQNRLKSAVVGRHEYIIETLCSFGTEVFTLNDNPKLQKPVRNHADMSCLHLGGRNFLAYDDEIIEKMTAAGGSCEKPDETLSANYPRDIVLNCLIVSKYIICNYHNISSKIKTFAQNNGLEIIDIKQGYARCSTAVIDESSFITADRPIAEKLTGKGFDVLLIRPGHILLDGYDYGFIGGCCGKIEKNKILFSGDVMKHPDGEKIEDFINKRNIEIICASDAPLRDFGGFVGVQEY